MKTGIIFDIKKYAIHDGPGIRTTIFFKGCPLSCWWCHNPEGISQKQELIYQESRCMHDCDECLTYCPQGAISRNHEVLSIDKKKCMLTGHCAEACPTGAIKIVGKTMSVLQVMEEIEKDRIFYEMSRGGITFSGGEPMLQIDFLDALLSECRLRNIHSTVDTSGHVPFEYFERIQNKTDLFFYDLKIIEDKKHQEMTGVSNQTILDNLHRLSQKKTPITVRIPVILGHNDRDANITQMADFLLSLHNIKKISLLPYHKMGHQKYKSLNKPFPGPNIQAPTPVQVGQVKVRLEEFGFAVRIGG